MSGNERQGTVNLTLIQPDDARPPLTNGQIAAITIATIFVFFISMLLIVCLGEYYKYLNGKRTRPTHVAIKMSARRDNTLANQLHEHLPPESSFSHSDLVNSSSLKDSESSREISQRYRHSSGNERATKSVFYGDVDVSYDESLERVSMDCVDACDVDLKTEHDVTILPLIQPCEDGLDVEEEIFCDSVDSLDSPQQYKLEADV